MTVSFVSSVVSSVLLVVGSRMVVSFDSTVELMVTFWFVGYSIVES